MPDAEKLWIAVGLGGQLFFFSRFFCQWVASEKAGRSVVPQIFWYLSLGGGLVLLSYSVWRRDPVFIVGQSAGILIYLRNLWFIHRTGK